MSLLQKDLESLDSSCAVLFDLDDTLYNVPAIAETVRGNIVRYLQQHLGIATDEVHQKTQQLYYKHGTTMAGLVAEGFEIDFDHYHSQVHATLDYASLLRPSAELREMLTRMTASKHIFTNADARHTAECLGRMGIEDAFESIYCFENVQRLLPQRDGAPPQVLCKPNKRCFEAVLQQLGMPAAKVVFIDDSPRNCAAAHDCGIFSILVGREGHVAGADLVIPTVLELPRVLPGLFAQEEPPRVEAPTELGVPIRVPA